MPPSCRPGNAPSISRYNLHYPHLTAPSLTARPPADGGVSVLDSLSHTLLSSIGATRNGKDWVARMRDFEVALRKMAATHPMLLLR